MCLFWVDVFSVGSKQMTLFLEIVCVFVCGCQFIQDCFFVPRVPVPEDLANQILNYTVLTIFSFTCCSQTNVPAQMIIVATSQSGSQIYTDSWNKTEVIVAT